MCLVTFSKTKVNGKYVVIKPENTVMWVGIELTKQCSHECAWCYGGYNYEPEITQMSVEQFTIMAEKLHKIGIRYLTVCGGEPTEHPNFKEIFKIASKYFTLSLITHGDWDTSLIDHLIDCNIAHIHYNFQGRKWHDQIHGVKGSYDRQIANIKRCKELGVKTVSSVTVASYNYDDLPEIFDELNELNIDRIRVWEATGWGNPFLKEKTPHDIFSRCEELAKGHGYNYSLSYDPDYIGDDQINCLMLEKKAMYVNSMGQVKFCYAAPLVDDVIINVFTDPAEDILPKYNAFMDSMQRDKPYCAAREAPKEQVVKFHKTAGKVWT